MRKTTKPASIQVSVTNEVKELFYRAAADQEMSMSTLARRLITDYLNNLEGDTK